MGLWGPAIFTIPLLAAWYSYEQLNVRTLRPDVRARGRTRARRDLRGVTRARRQRSRLPLETSSVSPITSSTRSRPAALLHHLGQVCLDEPEDGRARPTAVAQAARRFFVSLRCSPAGDIIAAEPMANRDKVGSPDADGGSGAESHERVRRAVTRKGRLASAALEASTRAGYVYSARVLSARWHSIAPACCLQLRRSGRVRFR
jgi:hypothetical protein